MLSTFCCWTVKISTVGMLRSYSTWSSLRSSLGSLVSRVFHPVWDIDSFHTFFTFRSILFLNFWRTQPGKLWPGNVWLEHSYKSYQSLIIKIIKYIQGVSIIHWVCILLHPNWLLFKIRTILKEFHRFIYLKDSSAQQYNQAMNVAELSECV